MGNRDATKHAVRFFAELGDLLARYAVQPGYALAMVIVGWILWPIGALIASLLIAHLYHRATQPANLTATPGSTKEAPLSAPAEQSWLVLVGFLLIAAGLFWLMHQFIPQVSFALVLMVIGLFVVLFGIAGRGGGSSHG